MASHNKTFLHFQGIPVALVSWLLLPSAGLLLLTTGNESLFLYLNDGLNRLIGPSFWAFITNFGDGFFLFPLAMLLAWKRPDRQLDILLAGILAAICLKITKGLIAADRPVALLGQSITNVTGPVLKRHSLPSGHSGTVFLFAGLSMIWLRNNTVLIVVMLAGLVALSRIAVGAHWPADILLGAWIGLVCTALGVTFRRSLRCGGLQYRLAYMLPGLVTAVVLPHYNNGFRDFGGVLLCQYMLAIIALLVVIGEIAAIYRRGDQCHSVEEGYAG
ncbi:phosphatase PAP2 family protein [Kistimonas asteriae]|uniref:phosphatase PAP2 family protein n=1 Tax=Kistimonas asteriae TaxID=517724 RepID=UPI001BA66A48|nr:phosphatase PAP2 family protein [Kistimonas asteriae]